MTTQFEKPLTDEMIKKLNKLYNCASLYWFMFASDILKRNYIFAWEEEKLNKF